MEQRHIFRSSAGILPPDVLANLSFRARSLYKVVWNRMRDEERTEVQTINFKVARAAHMNKGKLFAAQMELVTAGLLEIDFDDRVGFCPGSLRSIYRLPKEQQHA